MSEPDTDIAVVLTETRPGLAGAIGVIAVDGNTALERLVRVFRPASGTSVLRGGRLRYGALAGGDGTPLDEVLVATWNAAESPTGRPHAEVNIHGGPMTTHTALTALCAVGFSCRPRAELIRRAAGGSAGAIEIEARLALQQCRTVRQSALVSSCAARLRAAVRDGMRAVESGDIGQVRARWDRIARAGARAERLLATHRVALAGLPNAGKSTLVNRLAGARRAIVSDAPGTTRDPLWIAAQIEGLAVTLMDTAGRREAGEDVEIEAQSRGERDGTDADSVLAVVDGARPAETGLRDWLQELDADRTIVVCNKCDLPTEPGAVERLQRTLPDAPFVRISARTGEGIDALTATIASHLLAAGGDDDPEADDGPPAAFTSRQRRLIMQARTVAEASRPNTQALGNFLQRLDGRTNRLAECNRIAQEFSDGGETVRR